MPPNKKTGKPTGVGEKKPVKLDPTFGLVLKSGYSGPSSFFPIGLKKNSCDYWMVGEKRISPEHQRKITEAYRKGPERSCIDYLNYIGQIAPYSQYGEVCLENTYQLVHVAFISEHEQRRFAPEVLKNAMRRGDIETAKLVECKYSLEIGESDMPVMSTGAVQKTQKFRSHAGDKPPVRVPTNNFPFIRRKVSATQIA